MHHLLGASLLLAGFAAQAAPTVLTLSRGFSFVDYASSGHTDLIDAGTIDANQSLFWLAEKQGVQQYQGQARVNSFEIFFDPKRASTVEATLDFASPILAVYRSSAELSTSLSYYGAPGSAYGYSANMGLELDDSLSFSAGSSLLSLSWSEAKAGKFSNGSDHIRVITAALPVTAVPEPSGLAMLLAGLGVMGAVARRRLK